MPDATKLNSHAEIYEQMQLLWDPRAESDAYATVEQSDKSELNKSASLEFTVLPANIHYNDFHKKRTVVVVYDDDDWIFEGVVTDAPLDFYKRRKVTCADPMSFLCGSVQAPDEKNEINVSTGGSGNKYVPVPSAWYTGASPKGLSWYEQTIETVYAQVEQTDVYHSGTTYYIKSGDTYSQWSGGANDWVAVQAGNLKLYLPSGSRPKYTRSNDTSANADKSYYYLSTSNSQNYSGSTTTSAASTKETIIQHIERLLNVHNSQVDPFRKIHMGRMYNSSDSETHEFKAANFRSTWDALKSDILDEFGKYFRIELGEDHELYLDYLELHQLPTVPDAVAPLVEFANNMVNMNESNEDDDDIFTVLVPIGKNNLTVKDVTGHDSPAHDDANHEVDPYIATWGGNKRYVVVSRKAIKRYGYIIKPQSFSDVSDASTLWDRAKKYIQNNYDYHTEYEVKAVDMRFINGTGKRIVVGDKIRIHSQWHGVDTTDLYVISAEHDQSNPENDSYRIGIPTSDREANNRTLTGQSNAAKSKNASNNASNSSATSRLHSILEDYIHVTEWGLEMNSNLKNTVEAYAGKFTTQFIQDGEHINLLAQKLFGPDEDGYGDVDAGYMLVPTRERKTSYGKYKNPVEEVWYEKKGNKRYQLSTDTTCDPAEVGDKDYYVQNLATRVSQIDVGPTGIKGVVDGNYERSTYCSSWIKANEDSILAITGHIHVDDDGQVIIDSGTGVRTGHTSERTDVHYQAVPRTQYSNSPVSKKWYERVLNSAGKWTGDGVAESEIMEGATPATLGHNESKYYKRSTDATADPQKYYYARTGTTEEFTAEYGVYDENTLTGGVVARMVNNPSYFPVDKGTIEEAAKEGKIAHNLGWYVYDSGTGNFGLALANDPVHADWSYYTVKNTSEVWTDLRGDHIVIGPIDSSVDPDVMAKAKQYIDNKHLNGTITEIASDVVVVNTLLAKYIEADEITANTSIWAATGMFTDVYVETLHVIPSDWSDYNPSEGTIISDDWLSTGEILSMAISISSDTVGDIVFGDRIPENSTADRAEDPADIIMGFGDATVDGDDVTIPYLTAGDSGEYDEEHVITFTKPASIGKAVWSSGSGGVHDLKVYTVGGWNKGESPQWTFYHAQVTYPTNFLVGAEDSEGNDRIVYERNGSSHTNKGSMSTSLNNKPTIKAHMEISGEDWDRYGSNVGLYHDDTADDTPVIPGWSKYIFIDATEPYEDGHEDAKTKMALTDISKFTPGSDTELNEHVASIAQSTAYDSYYSYYMTYDGALLGNTKYIKTPSKGSVRTYASFDNNRDGTAEDIVTGTISLSYSENVTVYGQKKMDGETDWTSALNGLKITAPDKPSAQGATKAVKSDVTYNDGDSITLGYSDSVTVYGRFKLSIDSGYTDCTGITVKSPADNSSSLSTSDITLGDIDTYQSEPTADAKLTDLLGAIKECLDSSNSNRWVKFKVKAGSLASRTYKIDCG